MNPGSLY